MSSNISGRELSLNSKNNTPKDIDQITRELCDTYTDGVYAVLALVNESRWDPAKRELQNDAKYEVGRRMTTSAANKISPSTEVTPDCVLQTEARSALVAEAKLGLPREEGAWDDDIRQMQKYDDDLLGWWTADERISTFDIIGLVPIERAVKFSDRIENGIKVGNWTFERKWSVVGFFKRSGVKDFLALKKERGELSDSGLDDRLRQSVLVPFERLIVVYQDKKFVDHPPPLPYLLQIIWDYLFTQYAADATKAEGEEYLSLTVTLKKVTEDLQEYYGFRSNGYRSPEIPRQSWVRRALDLLVQFRMAKVLSGEEYLILYKRTRGDTLKRFGRLCHRAEQRAQKVSPTQLPLIPTE